MSFAGDFGKGKQVKTDVNRGKPQHGNSVFPKNWKLAKKKQNLHILKSPDMWNEKSLFF